MANFSSRKEKKYNVDEIANQLIEQIKNNNVNSSNINIQETTKRNTNNNSSLWNTVKETANNNTSWFKKSEAYKDNKGNWISDTTATTLSTIGDIGTGLVKGVMNIGEGIGDLITYGRAQIKENKGDIQRANKLRQHAQKDSVGSIFEPIQTKLDKNSVLGNKSDNIVEGLGYVAGVTAIGIATGGAATAATTATTFSSAMGQGMNQAYQEGASNDDAWKYGVISGLAEAGTELLFGGLGKASGAVGLSKSALPVDDMVAKKVSGVFKSCLGKNLSQYVIKSGAEGTEEVISGVIQALGQKLTYKSSEEIGKLIKDQNLLEQFITGTATSAIAQIPGNNGIYKTTKDGREFIPNSTESEIESNNTSNLQPQSTQNQQILLAQQSNQEENKVAQSGDVKQILPMQRYVYEKSDNIKIDNLRQDASKYWDNSEKTRNYINMLEKIIQDKNIDIRLDANLTDSKGNFANGSYSNGVITINPNSTRAGEFIAVHELTHAIGTDQMKNIVEKYRKSNTEFNSAVEQLLKNYNSTELTEEAMADVAGQLFGNQEFINNLAQTEPSLFQKIYNEIKYLWHQFTGYKNQDQFINDLQYKWEQAYRSNAKLNETTNYSIAGRKSLENIRDNKMLYNSGISSYKQAKQMANKNISNEQIRQQTGWFQDKNGDWKYEFSDKDMAIKNIKYEQNKNYRLGDILQHDTLFELYPELKQLTVEIDNTNKINGNYNKNSKKITLSNKLLNNSKRLEGTLIHEIQHAIQDIEGFEKGTTSKLSKERYYNSLGEIEADNTRKRFIDEKYKNKDIANEAPESSKTNPKHRNYDNYMNNRTTLDKVKDGMFKYFKGLGDSNEIFQGNNQKNIQQDIRLVDDGRNGRYLEESENNSGSFSMQDNQGKKLSRQQQERYKNVSSKLKDENGNLKRYYHGTQRSDRVGNYFDPERATSGPMAFFTDNQDIAKNYSENKQDTSISRETNTEYDLFKVDGKNLDDYWNSLSKEQQNKIAQEGYNIGLDEDFENIVHEKNASKNSFSTQYDYYLSHEEKGNAIKALYDIFIQDGNLMFEDMAKFQDVLKYAGVQNIEYLDQYTTSPKVYEVYLNITNPFDTSKISSDIVQKLKNKAKTIDNKTLGYSADQWDKSNITSYQWIARLEDDIKNGTTHAWTSIPDWVTNVLKENGYDGIVDTGGKNGGEEHQVAIPFYSNQIKNIDNTNPTDNPDIRYSQNNETWQSYLDKNYKATGTKTNLQDIKLPTKQEVRNVPVNEEKRVAQILEKPVQKVKEKDRSWAIIKANLIDKGMVFEELSRKTGNRDLQGKYDYTLTAQARGQNAIGNARYELDSDTKTQKQISKSLTEIIDEVGEDTTDFYNYMYHQLNIDRMTLEERFGGDTGINYERKNAIKNKPVFGESVTAQMSREKVQELEKKYPEFKEYAQDVYDYLDANTKELVDNGVISKETQQLFKDMYPHYVPISRIDTKGISVNVPLDTGRTGINSPIKKATGGSSNINPLFETMADRTLQTYRASARNNFGVELKNTLSKTNKLNQVTQQSDIDTIMEQMTDEKQNNQLLQEGKNGENPTFTVFENGNKVTYEISKDMYEALKPKNELLSKIDDSKFSKIANKVNNFRRGLLTEYNPIFSLTNAIKDSQDILLNSQHSAKTYSKIPEATAQILSKGYWYNEYIQNGGAQNSYFKDGEFEVTKNNLPTKIKNTVTFPLRAISNVNNVIEMTPRLAEYIVSREQGRSIETSMLDASRVTTNFKAGGDITKTLNRNGFTFLNASVQGMQQQIRNIQEANAKGLKGYAVLACKYAIAGVPVLLLNNLIWADDEEYEELQDYVKDNYYIIGKLSNGKFLRIPKGRAVATIQKIVSNANDFIKNDTINSDEVGKVFWEDLKENIQFARDNLAPNNPLENNIVSPVFQAITNKTWYGEDLVPTRLQNKPKEEQYDESTDKLSRWLGEKIGISPIKINYLLDQYSGGAGDILLPLGTPQAENNVIEDKFTTDSTMKSKYPGEFFSKVDELEINSNSSKATDEDIIKYKYISSVSSEIGKLYKKKRDIQNSDSTDEKKKEQLKEVQKQINELAKNSIENVDKITKGEKYAQIDTSQYYKDVEGEWQKVSDKDKEKNKKSELSLKTYSSYKYEMSKIKQQKVKKGEMTKDQSLKNDDKIQILLDSNYSDKEKTAIYENYIKTQTKEGEYDSFDVIKASSIDIDEYLKYEQQDFISDKKDDGTLDGKTVSKSKQKKVVQYLNSMKINGNQRLLLYAMQGYTTNSSQKSQLAQYVYNLKLDKDTKLELYNKFSGFKVYKDGRVKW